MLSPSCGSKYNKDLKLPQWENVCRGEPRDQPQPGSLSLSTRDPGDEVVSTVVEAVVAVEAIAAAIAASEYWYQQQQLEQQQ